MVMLVILSKDLYEGMIFFNLMDSNIRILFQVKFLIIFRNLKGITYNWGYGASGSLTNKMFTCMTSIMRPENMKVSLMVKKKK